MELSKKYFQTLIETSYDAIVLIDETGMVIYQSPSTERISGYSLEEIRMIDGIELIHPDDRAQEQDGFLDLVKTHGAVLQKKHRLKHKSGNYIWIEGTYRNLLHDESIRAIVYNYRDVTARVLSELKLKERIKELSTIYEVNRILQDDSQSVEVVFCRIVNLLPASWQYPDICKARIEFNNGEYKTPGYTATPFMQTAPIATVDGRKGMIEVAYTKEMAHEYEGPFLREERELIDTIARTVEVYFNKKFNQDALVKSKANLKSIFDNTKVSYLLLNVNYDILAFNQHYFETYTSISLSEIQVGRNYLEVISIERRENAKKVLDAVALNATPLEYEISFIHAHNVSYFNITVSPIMGGTSIIGFCISSFDITNRKNMEIERQKIVADIIGRNRDLQEFAQIVSHNLRGPLSTILGLANMLKEGIADEEKNLLMEGIGVSAEKLDSVVRELNSILDLKNKPSESNATVRLEEVMGEIHEKCAELILRCEADIRCDFHAVNELFTMRSYVFDILYNLVSNSLRFRDTCKQLVISISSQRIEGDIILTVTDNGVGIDLDKYGGQIFLLNRTFSNTADGKGLGLFMVKAQVDALKGTVDIESVPGKGTTVRIMLPVSEIAY